MPDSINLIKWPSPFTAFQLLDNPGSPINVTDVEPVAISADGSVVVGTVTDSGAGITYACRWDGTVCTVIGTNFLPYGISADGSTIYGAGIGGSDDTIPCVWIGGATTPTLLTPPTGYDAAFAATATTGANIAPISDDGSIIYGWCRNSSTSVEAVVQWINTVPHAITMGSGNQVPAVCSNDGSIAFAGVDTLSRSEWCGYYSGGSFFSLAALPGTTSAAGQIAACSGDGTLAYGTILDQFSCVRSVYWDDVSSNTGTVDGTPVYGNVHVLDSPVLSTVDTAANIASPIAVGLIDSFVADFPARWNGTTLTNLTPDPILSLSFYGRAFCCSGDGTIAAGTGGPTDSSAVYWDVDNNAHILPVPGQFPSAFVHAASRDGSTLLGRVDFTPSGAGGWEFIASTSTDDAGFGQAWFDPSYVDFSNPTVLSGFIGSGGTWVDWGQYGEVPTGSSPLNFLNVFETDDPNGITFGWGQSGGQDSWNNDSGGVDPTTGVAYAALAFDTCAAPPNTVQLTLTDLSVSVTTVSAPNEVTLRWSDDAGASWSNGLLRSLGRAGQYNTTPTWYRLGMSRNRIIELSWSGDAASALQGLFVEVTIAQT